MKKTIILTIALGLASTTLAERRSIRDRADNWLQNNSTETSGGLRDTGDQGWINGGTNPGVDDPTVQRGGPIGSGLAFLTLSGAGYALIRRRRSRN